MKEHGQDKDYNSIKTSGAILKVKREEDERTATMRT